MFKKDTIYSYGHISDKRCNKGYTFIYQYIPDDYLKTFQDDIVEKCNYGYGFSLEDALSEAFHDKTITTEEEVFAFLDNIDINQNNAFLLRR